jgi:hypothetical protein
MSVEDWKQGTHFRPQLVWQLLRSHCPVFQVSCHFPGISMFPMQLLASLVSIIVTQGCSTVPLPHAMITISVDDHQ